jgi:hypothetical protein
MVPYTVIMTVSYRINTVLGQQVLHDPCCPCFDLWWCTRFRDGKIFVRKQSYELHLNETQHSDICTQAI